MGVGKMACAGGDQCSAQSLDSSRLKAGNLNQTEKRVGVGGQKTDFGVIAGENDQHPLDRKKKKKKKTKKKKKKKKKREEKKKKKKEKKKKKKKNMS